MTDTLDYEFVSDVVPDDDAPDRCIVCGNPTPPYGGRGARPKYCEDHKRNRKGASGDRKPNPKIASGMADLYRMIALGVSILDSDDGMVIADGADRLGEAWAELASKDAKVKCALERMLTGSGWAGVIGAHAMVGFPIAVKHGLVPGMGSNG